VSTQSPRGFVGELWIKIQSGRTVISRLGSWP
jgi:hypothetical protein